jgi:predicted dehydrogenase
MVDENKLPESASIGIVDNDDECNMIVEFEGGAHGFIRSSRFHADRGLKICGSHGEIRWNHADGKLIGKIDEAKQFSEIKVPEEKSDRTIVSQFVENIRNDTDLAPTFFDGLKAQEVIAATLISVKERKWVSIPI